MEVTIRLSTLLRLSLVLAVATAAIGYGVRGAIGQQRSQPSYEQLMTKSLDDLEGKELTVTKIVYPPGTSAPAHRHPAHTAVYVVSGQVESSVDDEDPVVYGPGDVWYESHMQLHRSFRNPSATEPFTVVVFMLKDTGKPQTVLEP